MFFANSRERFLWINWLDCEQYGMNQKKKKNTINTVQCLSQIHWQFQWFFLSGREMAHDNKMKINLVVNYESKPVKSNLGWRHHPITWLHKTFKTEFRWPSWWQHQSASFCHWASSLLQASILRNRIEGKGGFEFSKFETWLVNYECYCENMYWCIHKATSV